MARDYGKVRVAFWADEKVASWSERLKFVALYLLTSAHTNAIGCFRLPIPYMMADTGLSQQQANDALATLESEGFVARCPRTSYVFLPRYLEHNSIDNAKVAIHCVGLLETIPQAVPFRSDLEFRLLKSLSETKGCETVLEELRKRIDTLSKGYRTPEPEPEPEPETEPEQEPEKTRARRAAPSKPAKAQRWPKDAVVPDAWLSKAQDARARNNLPAIDLRLQAEQFANYWAAKSGGGAAKLDWEATWINWALRSFENAKSNGNGTGQSRLSDHPLGFFGELGDEHAAGAGRQGR